MVLLRSLPVASPPHLGFSVAGTNVVHQPLWRETQRFSREMAGTKDGYVRSRECASSTHNLPGHCAFRVTNEWRETRSGFGDLLLGLDDRREKTAVIDADFF